MRVWTDCKKVAAILVVCWNLWPGQAARAATYLVTNLADSGPGTVRQAIRDAQQNPGADVISLSTLQGIVHLTTPLVIESGTLVIQGPGAGQFELSGSNRTQVLIVEGNANVRVSGVTLRDGWTTNSYGAGILNRGSLTITQCVISGHRAYNGRGGGIYNAGRLEVLSSVVASNWVHGGDGLSVLDGMGGGLYHESGSLLLSNTMVMGNQALGGSLRDSLVPWVYSGRGLGGGCFVEVGTMVAERVTFFTNVAKGMDGAFVVLHSGAQYGTDGADSSGGALHVQAGTMQLVNCTFAHNRSEAGSGGSGADCAGWGADASGGGMGVESRGSGTMTHCTFRWNRSIAGRVGVGGGSPRPGYSFGRDASLPGAIRVINSIIPDISASSFTNWSGSLMEPWVDPQLGELQDNGGFTLTMVPKIGSPAVDAGVPVGAASQDQRGAPRPQSVAVDIGAVELEAQGPPIIRWVSGARTVTVGANDVRLGASVFGSPPISFQWRHEDLPIPGATGTNLVLDGLRTNDAGRYVLVASNASGLATSAPVLLTVIPVLPAVLRPPQSQYVALGAPALFCVTTVGSPPLRYQWRWDGKDIPGATSAALPIPVAGLAQVGSYSVVVGNDFGAVTSQVASLVVFTNLPASTALAWGDNGYGQTAVPDGLTNVVDVYAGGLHSAVRLRNGSIVVWGGQGFTTLSNLPTWLPDVASMAFGDSHALALRSNGTVVAWGDNAWGQTQVPPGLTDAIAVAAGRWHSVALRRSGQVVVWGGRNCGASLTNLPTDLGRAVAIAAGDSHTLVLRENGTVAAWGCHPSWPTNVPMALSNVTAIAAGGDHCLALRSDGIVFDWDPTPGYTAPPAGSCGFRAGSAGVRYSLGLLGDGSVVGWGSNYTDRGQLDIPAGLVATRSLAAGRFHSLALGIRLPPQEAPVVTAFSGDQIAVLGRPLSLGVSAMGAGPICYQWFKEGRSIRHGTNATFTMPRVTDAAGGQFSVVLSNTHGVVTGGYAQVTVYRPLQLTVAGGGSVGRIPDAAAYPSNAQVSLVATSSPGWSFLHWLGGVTDTNPTVSIRMERERCLEARFGTTLTAEVAGLGFVESAPAMRLYPYGAIVRLSAVPQQGRYFVRWEDRPGETNNPLSLVVTGSNPSVTAVFAPLPAGRQALTVLAEGSGEVTLSPPGPHYDPLALVTLTAAPGPGQSFLGWAGDAGGTENPMVLSMASSRIVRALFTRRPSLAWRDCEGLLDPTEAPVQLIGEPGRVLALDVSTNLQHWSRLALLTNLFGTVQFNDTVSRPQSFYRVSEEIEARE